MIVDMDKKGKIEQACQSGEEFAKKFYQTFDKRRHLVSNLYLDTATVIWNGNSVSGKEAIAKFVESLPASESTLRSIDAQPVNDEFVQGQTTILVLTSGFQTYGRKCNQFSESFLLTAHAEELGNVWKIVSNCLRFHEPA